MMERRARTRREILLDPPGENESESSGRAAVSSVEGLEGEGSKAQ
jgi:hypothetical protein